MMKVFRLFLCTTLLGLLTTACNSDSDSDNSQELNNNEETELIITVSLPDGWVKKDGSVIEHHYTKGSATLMIKNESFLDNMKLDDAVDKAMEEFRSSFDNINLDDPVAMEIDGYDALSVTFTYAMTMGIEVHMKMQSIYLMINKECWVISIGESVEGFSTLSDDISYILNNIDFSLS